jgi:hypothetical protein
MTTSVRIDRLTLRAGAISESDARRLAELVGFALGRLPATTNTVNAPATVAVTVSPQEGRSVEQIADAVASAIADALRIDRAR